MTARFRAALAAAAFATTSVVLGPIARAQNMSPFVPTVHDDAIARWLPRFGNPFDAFHHKLAAPGRVRQTYVVDGQTRSGLLANGVILDALDAGTFISFGSPETVTGHVAYDAIASATYYHVGCCGSYDWVLARTSSPPPYPVFARPLGKVRTTLGTTLGDSTRKVIAQVGPAKPQPIIGRPGFTELSYVWFSQPRAPHGSPGSSCGQWQNFVFERGKLVFIDLTDAC